ncbi:hypothetical protein BpHYR1_035634 [Brachionus plicatilis]|uniref:Uncharacterized protein n=1 Tax=Brachionus plicatilis TaxID=10195 RepID=A0A3M7RPY0_BRAPC|nr:hypothetical protein BpHYR1_035634 [Brachionus plicatilis]
MFPKISDEDEIYSFFCFKALKQRNQCNLTLNYRSIIDIAIDIYSNFQQKYIIRFVFQISGLKD